MLDSIWWMGDTRQFKIGVLSFFIIGMINILNPAAIEHFVKFKQFSFAASGIGVPGMYSIGKLYLLMNLIIFR